MKQNDKKKRAPKEDWCDYQENFRDKKPKGHFRCPKCRRSLELMAINVNNNPFENPCIFFFIPPHKIPKTKRT